MAKRTRHALPARDPFSAALDEIGDQWTFLLLREAFFGVRRFDDFAQSLAIPRARLTERLRHLTDIAVLERCPYHERPPRFEYRFTAKGLDTYPIALALMAWGDQWRADAGGGPRLRLFHQSCDQQLRPRMVCGECAGPIELAAIEWSLGDARGRPNATVRRWRRVDTLGDASSRNDSVAHALEAIGDRWSMHIVHEAMRGTLRFAELQGVLGIATNTLTQRLRSLCREGVLVRGPGEGRGSTGYALTDAGRGLLPVLLSIRAWGAQWRGVGESWRIVHRDCGSAFEVECRCDACEELIDPRQVRVEAPQD